MNKVIIMGRLTRDPDVRYTTGNEPKAVARFTVAVDRKFARRDDENAQTADFIGCVAFSRLAEFAEKWLRQGTKVVVTGRLQTGSYTDKDGRKVYTTDVVAEDVEFAESKRDGSVGSAQTKAQAPAQTQAADDGFMNIDDSMDDDGLPFN